MTGFLYGFFIFVEIVTAVLLIFVILLQKSKSHGMGGVVGGMGESVFGPQMGNVLTKITVILMIIFLASTLALAMIGARRSAGTSSVTDDLPDDVPVSEQAQ